MALGDHDGTQDGLCLINAANADGETSVSVVVATCNRPWHLSQCLRSLLAQTHQPTRVIVVDDDPGGTDTPEAVAVWARQASLTYVAGAGHGLAAAHNRGLLEVETRLVAFTDDDVIVHERWLERIVAAFASTPNVGCVTGMIRPRDLQTREQLWLEGYAGFNKGFKRRLYDLADHRPDDPLFPFNAGTFGSGANMAFSTAVLRTMGGFDPALGTGTRARGGDDLSAFFEVLQRGHRLVYEPAAIVAHRHSRDYESLRRTVFGYGVGLTAYLTKCLLDRPRLLSQAVRQIPRAAGYVLRSDSAKNARLPRDYPATLTWLERLGMLAGPFAYAASRRAAGRQVGGS